MKYVVDNTEKEIKPKVGGYYTDEEGTVYQLIFEPNEEQYMLLDISDGWVTSGFFADIEELLECADIVAQVEQDSLVHFKIR